MSELQLDRLGDYDRNRPLIDGAVQIDGVDPVIMTLTPEELFFRAMRHEAFDVRELSLSRHRSTYWSRLRSRGLLAFEAKEDGSLVLRSLPGERTAAL